MRTQIRSMRFAYSNRCRISNHVGWRYEKIAIYKNWKPVISHPWSILYCYSEGLYLTTMSSRLWSLTHLTTLTSLTYLLCKYRLEYDRMKLYLSLVFSIQFQWVDRRVSRFGRQVDELSCQSLNQSVSKSVGQSVSRSVGQHEGLGVIWTLSYLVCCRFTGTKIQFLFQL